MAVDSEQKGPEMTKLLSSGETVLHEILHRSLEIIDEHFVLQ